MAELVYGFASSHGPLLSMPPETWEKRGDVDRRRTEVAFRDSRYTYEELLRLRRGDYLIEQNHLEARIASHVRCQAALDELATRLAAAKPDVLIVIGDDQHEWFRDTVQPAFAVVTAKAVLNTRFDSADYADATFGLEYSAREHRPAEDQSYPVATGLALSIAEQAIEDGFDVTTCGSVPTDADGPLCITHSVGFIVRRIMRDKPVPLVPILQNTFWAPNRPKPGRCFDFGQSIARAVRAWKGDNARTRVAVCASGGLSHYVVDEEWDKKMLAAMQSRDDRVLRNEPNSMFQSGTSETKNWITTCGVLSDTRLSMHMIDYVPCYRTEAGTGNAMGFAIWE